MIWIVLLTAASAAVVANLARHAIQDHRDAELQRREALEDLTRLREPRRALSAPAAASTPPADRERSRDVQREGTPGVALPREVTGPTSHEDRARTR